MTKEEREGVGTLLWSEVREVLWLLSLFGTLRSIHKCTLMVGPLDKERNVERKIIQQVQPTKAKHSAQSNIFPTDHSSSRVSCRPSDVAGLPQGESRISHRQQRAQPHVAFHLSSHSILQRIPRRLMVVGRSHFQRTASRSQKTLALLFRLHRCTRSHCCSIRCAWAVKQLCTSALWTQKTQSRSLDTHGIRFI